MVILAFLAVAVVSDVGGVPVLFYRERTVSGWEGAQYGVMLFAVICGVKVWPLLTLELLGAVVGVLAEQSKGDNSGESVNSLRI